MFRGRFKNIFRFELRYFNRKIIPCGRNRYKRESSKKFRSDSGSWIQPANANFLTLVNSDKGVLAEEFIRYRATFFYR